MVNLRSATTGAAFAFGIVDVTEIVVEEPDVDVCNFAGNGLPGAFFKGFLASCGLTIFGERVVAFLAGAFFAAAFLVGAFLAGAFFAAAFLAGAFLTALFFTTAFFAGAFFAGAALLFFLNNFLIATSTP
jgi:uncharacterized protein YjbI with pentapeptide repeats